MKYERTINIPADKAATIAHALTYEPKDKSETFLSDDSIWFTAHFDDGHYADIFCSGVDCFQYGVTNKAVAEGVLYDKYDDEDDFVYATNDFFADWTFQWNDEDTYVVHVTVDKEN